MHCEVATEPSELWKKAQIAEKNCWESLWNGFRDDSRQSNIFSERMKGAFLIRHLEQHLVGCAVEERAQGRILLDVACGPVSYASQIKGAKRLEGVDPLIYPDWVYEQYARRDFLVHKCRLEDLDQPNAYDLVLCYNALQHFADLDAATRAIFKLLRSGGQCLIVDYLEVPTDAAHLLLLTKDSMHQAFLTAGFAVKSLEREVRLDGLVELGGGRPVKIYLGVATK